MTSRDGDPRYLRQALMALADLRRVTEPVETRESSSSGPAGVRPTRWDLTKLTNEELRQMQRMAKKACPTTPSVRREVSNGVHAALAHDRRPMRSTVIGLLIWNDLSTPSGISVSSPIRGTPREWRSSGSCDG